MEDAAFLNDYDPQAYDRPSVTVDCALLGLLADRLHLLLVRRRDPPFAGCWALPGGFVAIDEPLDAAAGRVLAQKVGLTGLAVEQVHAFGAVERDPRMRIVAIAYRALLRPAELVTIPVDADHRLAAVDADGTPSIDGQAVDLAFDHADILRVTLAKLRAAIDEAAFALVPERFTLRELQAVHEAVLGHALNKPAFRRRMLDRGRMRATGDVEERRAFRPAELYIHVPKG